MEMLFAFILATSSPQGAVDWQVLDIELTQDDCSQRLAQASQIATMEGVAFICRPQSEIEGE